jgi:hypothetical protein
MTSYTFVELDIEIDPSDPYAKSISAFRAFTKRFILALTRSTYWYPKLHEIYNGLPTAKNEDAYLKYRAWVKDATVKHPQRRTAQQHMWLYIVEMQSKEKTRIVQSMVNRAIEHMAEWKADTYEVDNLREDPDKNAQYFFENIRTVHGVELDTPSLGTSCLICTEDFDADAHMPARSPCSHFQCKGCHEKALDADSTKFACPFCRACLVCNRSGCVDHVVPARDREEHFPAPLPGVLESAHMLCNGPLWFHCGQPLFGLSPKRFWELREKTREFRSSLTRVQEAIENEIDVHHIVILREVWRRYWNQIELAAVRVKQEHLMDTTRW